MMRLLPVLLLVMAVAVWPVAALAHETQSEPARAPALSLDDLLTLLASGVTPTRAATLVKERGVNFELTEDAEKKLRLVGADDALLLAIARARPAPPPPKPEPEPAKPPPPTADKARAVLHNAMQGIGGVTAFGNHSTVVMRRTVSTPSGEMTAKVRVFSIVPDKLRIDIETPNGVLTIAWDGEQGWAAGEGGVQDLPPYLMENGRRYRAGVLWHLLYEAFIRKRSVQFVESVLLEGRECDVIVVTDARGYAVKLFVEKSTGRVLRRESEELSQTGGLVEAVEMYYDFRPVGAATLPFREVAWHDGRKSSESFIESWQIKTIDPALFTRPAAPARQPPSRRK